MKSAEESPSQDSAIAGAYFVTRGDQSGTHVKELEVWNAAGLSPNSEKTTGT